MTGDKYFINGRWWVEENITIKVIPFVYDENKSKIEFLKREKINLNYGASNNFPISIYCPKGYDLEKLKMLGIDYKIIPRDSWFKY